MPDGNRYSDAPNATDRAAWKVVLEHAPDKTETQAREIIKTWVKNGVLVRERIRQSGDPKAGKRAATRHHKEAVMTSPIPLWKMYPNACAISSIVMAQSWRRTFAPLLRCAYR